MYLDRFSFYQDRVAVNFLAKDPENAKNVVDAMEGNAVIGLLSKNFATMTEAVEMAKKYLKKIPVLSIGLGAGDPKQWSIVADIAAELDPGHVNQVYTAAGYTVGLLKGKGCDHTFVNALISPTGTIGKVKISTGAESNKMTEVLADIDTAVMMLKEVGVQSIKFFNMAGLKHIEELKAVAESCVRMGMPVLEPTGGIGLENIREIVKVCMDAGCPKVIPHVYSSAIDKKTGLTEIQIVRQIYEEIKKI
ncbi:2-dehydro-3-deoxy-phosphogluconate aldolase [Sporomusaceae bacterium BoRhaA]|uniref:2-dehydro-3-deoxy-phosphogluconate aldolase n=1 Tax=Pelorhabdus rhamnosifermentans TaxID=2772457 RepID=UPI001C061412|nr:KDGP aldolase [Pelorhabdus rhamnosifermentans]MBU2702739.1 2-dehydro-3-deoxy-phosphogluconate aldolase [Pelorhabdus rhamnosifermentans]